MERTFIALGSVLNSVLASMLKDITDLDDITTAESQRLNEILKLVHPVEQLFAEAPGAVSVSLPPSLPLLIAPADTLQYLPFSAVTRCWFRPTLAQVLLPL
jgi:hypothetical protein